jgi:2-deoxy-D-gluconate 3-dehydrogenase
MTWGPFDLSKKSAIVTGGAMGIGFGIAHRFIEAGADVLIADVNEKAAYEALRRLPEGPGGAIAMAMDVSAEGAGEEMVAHCVQQFSSVNILVNNAGIFPQLPMLRMTRELFDRVYRINLQGLAFAAKAAAAQMIKQGGGGKIINITSVDAVHPSMVGLAAYGASKGAVLTFTKSFALEMAPYQVHVNAIAPGAINTEGTSRPLEGSGMTEDQLRQLKERLVKAKIPLARMGIPDDIAKVAVFLASSASDYMTGSSIVVDGGMLLA